MASMQLKCPNAIHHRNRSCKLSRRPAVTCSAAARTSPGAALTSIAAAAAATLLQLSASGATLAAPLYDNLPGFGGEPQNVFYQAVQKELQQRGPDLDEIFDENLATEELRNFVDKVLGGKLKPEQYQSERLKMNFRRELDGRVSVRSRQGVWYSVRPDMQVPGFLLLRDDSGAVFFLPPDSEGDGLAQLDLSDDLVVAELFYSTAWQDVMAPLSVRTDDGAVTQLRLSEGDFRNVVSFIDGAEEPEEEEAAEGVEAGEQQLQPAP